MFAGAADLTILPVLLTYIRSSGWKLWECPAVVVSQLVTFSCPSRDRSSFRKPRWGFSFLEVFGVSVVICTLIHAFDILCFPCRFFYCSCHHNACRCFSCFFACNVRSTLPPHSSGPSVALSFALRRVRVGLVTRSTWCRLSQLLFPFGFLCCASPVLAPT